MAAPYASCQMWMHEVNVNGRRAAARHHLSTGVSMLSMPAASRIIMILSSKSRRQPKISTPSCGLLLKALVAAAAASVTSSGWMSATAAAFVRERPTPEHRSVHRLFQNGDDRRNGLLGCSSSAVVDRSRTPYNRHFYSQLRSSSTEGRNGGAWSEVFQNAIGTLDRRLDSKESVEKEQRERNNDGDRNNHIEFVSPLLEDGYPPAVLEYEQTFVNNDNRRQQWQQKPILLYLPGFDGAIVAPFLQFPSLGEEFDVRAMKVGMKDRSTFEELKDTVVEYVLRECRGRDGGLGAVYLMGESFGGILATEVALELNQRAYVEYIDLRGLVLVNPATSYLRSSLYKLGPPIANAPNGNTQYTLSLVTQLVPLFLDQGRAIQQLITILSSKGLPSVVNGPQQEAYMGRVAFDLPNRLDFMPKETLKWRLEEWLEWGCGIFEDRLEMLRAARLGNDAAGDAETYALLTVSQELRTVIIVGEIDATLPSREEAARLSSEVFRKACVHVVPGAGHASTCGGSLDLLRVIREVFPEIGAYGSKAAGAGGPRVELHGLEPRYDSAWIGLNPLLYWSKDYYRKWRRG